MSLPGVELRFLIPAELDVALRAIAHARGLSHTDVAREILETNVHETVHESTVIERFLRGNGIDPETLGTHRNAPARPGRKRSV